jgi:hypothetical protein
MRYRTFLAVLGAATLLSVGGIAASAQEATAPQTEAATEAAAPEVAPADPNTAAPEAATTETAPSDPAAATDPAAASEPVTEAAVEPPGRIIFFRPSRLSGSVYTYNVVTVGEDGDSTPESPRVGRLPNGSYFEQEFPPGIYNFNIRGPMSYNRAEDRLRLEVESGETYYVEQTIRMGMITGGFALVPSTELVYRRRPLRRAPQNED